MTIWDDRILELASEWDSVSPMKLKDSGYFKISRQQISRRLAKLREHGLLKDLGNGVYIITERGEKYLDGDISTYEDEPDEIPENEENEPTDTKEPGNAG